MARNKDYTVGYKRPPVETQFKPGQSGNPAGRPRGSRNMKTAVRQVINTEVTVTVGGKRRQMTLLDALVYRLFNTAVTGDMKAVPHALALARLYDEDDGAVGADETLEAQRLELVRQLLRHDVGGKNEPPAEK